MASNTSDTQRTPVHIRCNWTAGDLFSDSFFVWHTRLLHLVQERGSLRDIVASAGKIQDITYVRTRHVTVFIALHGCMAGDL